MEVLIKIRTLRVREQLQSTPNLPVLWCGTARLRWCILALKSHSRPQYLELCRYQNNQHQSAHHILRNHAFT